MKDKKYHTVGTIPKSNRTMVETKVKSIPFIGTDTSLNSGGVSLEDCSVFGNFVITLIYPSKQVIS